MHTTKHRDDSKHTCQAKGTTNFEDLIQAVYPDLLQVNHNNFDDRGILLIAPTKDSIDEINEFFPIHVARRSTAREEFRPT